MSPEQTELHDRIVARRGTVPGPFQVWLRSPRLGDRAEEMGTYCLRESALPPRLRELCLLLAARHFEAQHSWNAHVDKGVEAGIDRAALLRLARGQEPEFTAEDERVLYRFATEVLDEHFVRDETFAAARELLGERELVDVIGALGTFSMFAMLLNTFEVDLQPDREPPFPGIEGYRRVDGHTGAVPPRATGAT
jgi:4-carboxymuconolactone decarboxylase